MSGIEQEGHKRRLKDKITGDSLLPFALVNYFAFTSFAVILVAAFALSWLIADNARANLIKRSEAYSQLFADNLNRQVFVQFVLPTAVRYGRIAISDHDQYAALDEIVKNLTQGMNINEVTIYDSVDNIVAYSTVPPLMGQRGLGGEEYSRAARGEENSVVFSSGSLLSLLPSKKPITCVMKTYVPFRQEAGLARQTDTIMGVIEVEQDISREMHAIVVLQGKVIVLSLAIMSLLFAILSMIVVRANRIMARRAEERIRLEEELSEAQRLASLGKMVASVSHEIKNPLGIVRSTAEVLAGRIAKLAPGSERLATIIVDETTRLDRIVREFLDFARPRAATMSLGQLQEPAERALAFLRSELDHADIAVETCFAPGLPDVLMDSAHLYQVVFNMIYNAMQAMQPEGRLRLETRLGETGASVELSITDTGCGIAAEDLDQIFTPFYTKKNRGTGLGLAIAHSIVEKHGGRIEVNSLPGAGSTFTISLPVPSPKVAGKEETKTPQSPEA